MAIVDDILAWAAGLPAWQSDALRRLFRQGELTRQDRDELLALIKEVHGSGPHAAVRPVRIELDDVPNAGATATVRLLRLGNLQDVNRFPPGRSLDLAPDRLTVVFGENGAGKSGYARILKNACRARVRQLVLTDAFDPARADAVPSADITYSMGTAGPTTVPWRQGELPDSTLANVTVYDSLCGADYIAKEGVCEYQPYGLPTLNRLAALQRDLQGEVDRERQQIRLSKAPFAGLEGDHPVGELVAKLGRDTDVAKLQFLATIEPDEAKRVEELVRILGTLNPEPEARAAERLAQRLEGAAVEAQKDNRYVTNRALDEIKQRQQNEKTTKEAWLLAQRQLNHEELQEGDGLLPGTGNDVWKSLFKAAEKFSTEFAYTGHDHPNVGQGAKCVLCQTVLQPKDKERMQCFARYVADDASKNAEEASMRLSQTMRDIAAVNLNPVDQQTLDELVGVDADLHKKIAEITQAWGRRRAWAQRCVEKRDWLEERPALPQEVALDVFLTDKAIALRSRAKELRAAMDPKAKASFEQELVALRAREQLGRNLAAVEQYVADDKALHALNACYAALNPAGVSRQMTRLAGTYVTDALAEAMNQELVAVGLRQRRVVPKIAGRTDVGRTLLALKIQDCQAQPSDVLSEGEQRAMSLAMFLAELRLQNHASTVVFDDPSTSFDHRNRRLIAQRLVTLAAERPVVVFTHDAVFLAELANAVTRLGQSCLFQTVG